MDLTIVALLAAVALLEGIRRVPRGVLILQRSLWFPWRAWTTLPTDSSFQLLSWWSPLLTTVILNPGPSIGVTDAAVVRQRLSALRPWLLLLRILGFVVLVALVGGIPAAVGLLGGLGFLLAIGIVTLLSAACSLIAFLAARRYGKPRSEAAWWAFPLISPFTAPRAAESLLEDGVRGMSPALVAQLLLPPNAFLGWLRPHAYDLAQGAAPSGQLLAGLDSEVLRLALEQADVSDPAATSRCRRCGASFLQGTTCSDCGVLLTPIAPAGA